MYLCRIAAAETLFPPKQESLKNPPKPFQIQDSDWSDACPSPSGLAEPRAELRQGGHADAVGIVPDDATVVRLVDSQRQEQQEEWQPLEAVLPRLAAVSSNARCRFRTSDILLVRQALYR